jgi:hypothetical protein
LWGDGWGWALFKADVPDKQVATDYKKDCLDCHVPAKSTDWIYVKRLSGPPIEMRTSFPVKRHITEETIPMKQTWRGHSAFRIEAGEAKIVIDALLPDNPSRDNGWSGYVTDKNSTQGGDR